jgi:hypothetical protein
LAFAGHQRLRDPPGHHHRVAEPALDAGQDQFDAFGTLHESVARLSYIAGGKQGLIGQRHHDGVFGMRAELAQCHQQ